MRGREDCRITHTYLNETPGGFLMRKQYHKIVKILNPKIILKHYTLKLTLEENLRKNEIVMSRHVLSWFSLGSVLVQSWFSLGSVLVQSWFSLGSVLAQS
ncbi:hypothetical protein NL108_015454 [Boleophthalmus pectinirostris]|nr:hypothetical protein NL108_015454 [Boleophthalmus pectinirostris]